MTPDPDSPPSLRGLPRVRDDDVVDAFVKCARFDTIPEVQRRLRTMRCIIGPECRFARPETTKMNLEHTFGSVTFA